MKSQSLYRNLVLPRRWVRELDRRAIENYHIPGIVLMENAGRGATDILEALGINGPVVICCGKGNNAGDGLVIARHLDLRGYRVQIVMLTPGELLTGDALLNYQIVRAAQLSLTVLPEDASEESILAYLGNGNWIIDALLGTGTQGEPRKPFDTVIRAMNRAREGGKRVLALDLPSGLDCDTGQPSRTTIQADHTVTFAAIKPGLISDTGRPFVGQLHVVHIGVPRRLIHEILTEREKEEQTR